MPLFPRPVTCHAPLSPAPHHVIRAWAFFFSLFSLSFFKFCRFVLFFVSIFSQFRKLVPNPIVCFLLPNEFAVLIFSFVAGLLHQLIVNHYLYCLLGVVAIDTLYDRVYTCICLYAHTISSSVSLYIHIYVHQELSSRPRLDTLGPFDSLLHTARPTDVTAPILLVGYSTDAFFDTGHLQLLPTPIGGLLSSHEPYNQRGHGRLDVRNLALADSIPLSPFALIPPANRLQC